MYVGRKIGELANVGLGRVSRPNDPGMEITFRRLTPDDYLLFARWLGAAHVERWWHEPATLEHVSLEYGSDPLTQVYVASLEDEPIGIVQSYLVDDYPVHLDSVGLEGAVGVDLLIGEESATGRGVGTSLLLAFTGIIRAKYPSAPAVIADPEVANLGSIRAFEKAGYVKGAVVAGENGDEQLMILKL